MRYKYTRVGASTHGSKRRDKCKLKIAKLYQKITNQRDFFLHNCSTQLVNNFDCIFIEDLGVKDMLESKLMSKQISDASWSKFVNMLTYKADWYGKTVHKVDRYYASSKTCSCCGYINKELTLKDREWTCNGCGTLLNRDVNAAINIKSFALKNYLSGEHTLKNQDELLTLVKVLTPEAHPIAYGVGG